MNFIKTTLLSALFVGLLPIATATAQGVKALKEQNPEFFKTDEARRIGDQLLVWQRNTGGWPKNIDMTTPLTDDQRLQEIGTERRNGYAWYNDRPQQLYRKYNKWKKKWCK